MRVRHSGPEGPGQRVEVAYLPNGTMVLKTVKARSVILACWHSTIPYMCPELPAEQKTALEYAIKVPLVYTNVFIRRWTAFQKLGVQRISTARDVAHLGGPGLPGEPRRLPVPD